LDSKKVDDVLGRDFRTRALTALVGAPLVVLAVIIGTPLMDVAVMAVGVIAGVELLNMIRPAASRTALVIVVVTVLASIEGLALAVPGVIAGAVALFFAAGLVRSLLQPAPTGPYFIRNYLYLIFGALYIGIPLGIVLLIRAHEPDGLLWTLMLFANNWATDSFALIGGRVAGRHKLAPAISPGKTIEGALIGLVCGFGLGLALGLVGGLPPLTAVIANLVVALATQAGDLFESWAKRRLAVKDSGTLLPGHGGLLDRIDGFLLAAPLLYLVLRLLG
jgi:phosphatidate cytidylyltransferase